MNLNRTMNFSLVLSGHLCPRPASLFALLNIPGKLSKDWTEWHTPPHDQKTLLWLCFNLNCSHTAFGPFHFLPTSLGHGMAAFWVLQTKSKAHPRWVAAIGSGCDSPWRFLTSFSLSMLWQGGAAWVSYSTWSDLLGVSLSIKPHAGWCKASLWITSLPLHHRSARAQN